MCCDFLKMCTYDEIEERSYKSLLLRNWIRNEEAINSTQNRIFSLKVFHVLLYRRSSVLQDIYFLHRFWIDRVRVYEYMKINGLDSREVISLPEMRAKTWWTSLWTWRVISIIIENKRHAHHKTHCIQWKFTSPDQLASPSKFCSLKYSFTCSKVISPFKR